MEYEYRLRRRRPLPRPPTGIETEDHCVCSYALTEGDPLSAVARIVSHSDLIRGAELEVRVDTVSELRADAHDSS